MSGINLKKLHEGMQTLAATFSDEAYVDLSKDVSVAQPITGADFTPK